MKQFTATLDDGSTKHGYGNGLICENCFVTLVQSVDVILEEFAHAGVTKNALYIFEDSSSWFIDFI